MFHRSLIRLATIISLFLSQASPGYSQKNWFSDGFGRLEISSSWRHSGANWILRNGVLSVERAESTALCISSYYIYGRKPFSVEVVLRGERSGVIYNMHDSLRVHLSQMVWFELDKVFSGFADSKGHVVRTGEFISGRSTTEWTTLTLRINPVQRSCEIYVDGRHAGTDTLLRFISGRVGLVVQSGFSEFRSFRITGSEYQGKLDGLSKGNPGLFRHISYVESVGRNLKVYDPERRTFYTVDQDGLVKDFKRDKTPPQLRTSATQGDVTFSISGTSISRTDRDKKDVRTIVDRLVAPASLLASKNSHASIVLYVSDPGAGAILGYDAQGNYVAGYTAQVAGGFTAPRGLDFHGRNEIVVADYDRLLIIPRSLDETVTPLRVPAAAGDW